MNLKIRLLTLGLLAANGAAWGQQCPQGTPGTPNCIPPDHPGSPYANQTQPSVRRMIWADRWGAIATDSSNGGVGAVTGLLNKRMAEEAALKKCRAKGGNGCKVSLTYYNQCGAMAWGATHMATAHAASIEKASELAIKSCAVDSTDCRIYYADCSMAERIQ